jgi:hypothetical protein
MKITIIFLLVFSIAISTLVTGSRSSATNVVAPQKPNANSPAAAKANRYRQKLPRNAVPGSTDERRAAWEGMTADQKQKLAEKIRRYGKQAKEIASKMETPTDDDGPFPSSLTDMHGRHEAGTLRRLKKSDAGLLDRLSNAPAPRKSGSSAAPGNRATSSALRNHTSRDQAQSTKSIDEFVRTAFPDWNKPASDRGILSANKTASESLLNSIVRRGVTPTVQTGDADGDGLPDGFENQVADTFTPFYHVSTNEPDHFAFFGDFLPETVIQTVSPYTPISHFRVTPLGFSGDHTQAYLRIDYWTLWDFDSGFVFDSFCQSTLLSAEDYMTPEVIADIDLLVLQLSSHPLDNERSAILVAAPVADPNNPTFSSDPMSYSELAFFLSAHENQIGDRSAIYYPGVPIPATGPSHIELTLARSKHAHDPFQLDNPSYPDGLPLVPGWIIAGAYAFVSVLFITGRICLPEFLAATFLLDVSFFSCIVEHFGDSGGTFASPRINMGELGEPLNGCHFIQGGELFTKMNTPIPW